MTSLIVHGSLENGISIISSNKIGFVGSAMPSTRVDDGGALPFGCLSFSISLAERILVSPLLVVSGVRSSN